MGVAKGIKAGWIDRSATKAYGKYKKAEVKSTKKMVASIKAKRGSSPKGEAIGRAARSTAGNAGKGAAVVGGATVVKRNLGKKNKKK